MYSDVDRLLNIASLSGSLLESEIYFRMTGGLGNQLFGLSESYLLHKITGKQVVIDFGHIDHVAEKQKSPFCRVNSWMRQVIFLSADSAEPVPLKNLATDKISNQDRYFTGWRPSLSVLEESNFFQKSTIPAHWSQFVSPIEKPFVALHLRFGDYLNSPSLGGDITVDRGYVRRALNIIKSELGLSFVKVFSDNQEMSRRLCNSFSDFEFQFLFRGEPIRDLIEFSQAEAIVASASTFSFWAAYFSKANKVIFPGPFFPVNPRWEKELMDKSWIQLQRTDKSIREVKKLWNLIFRKESKAF